ncbi:MAG: hypothetical protein EA442_04645, partial [Candidatus Nitrosopelagicus sp.]
MKNDIWWFIENFTKNNSLYPYDFSNSEFVTNLTEVAGWKENQKEIELERINKEKLFHYQISCLLFPSPFSNIDESNGNDLIHLSEAYEYLRMLDCAIIARTIQNMITNDQNPKILALTNTLNFSNETSKSGIIKKCVS